MEASKATGTRRVLAGASRIALLETLRRAHEPLTIQQLVDELGLHGNTVRFHLARLTQNGLVRESQADPSGPGRPRLVYTAVSEEDEEPQSGYQLLAEILAGHLAATSPSPAADAVLAGLEWGRHLAERPAPFASPTADESMRKVVSLLDELGFEPEREEGGTEVRLYSCPFRTVAQHRPDVACSVHLGLVRGALSEMGAPIQATDLRPSFTGEPCLAMFDTAGQELPAEWAERMRTAEQQVAERHAPDGRSAGTHPDAPPAGRGRGHSARSAGRSHAQGHAKGHGHGHDQGRAAEARTGHAPAGQDHPAEKSGGQERSAGGHAGRSGRTDRSARAGRDDSAGSAGPASRAGAVPRTGGAPQGGHGTETPRQRRCVGAMRRLVPAPPG